MKTHIIFFVFNEFDEASCASALAEVRAVYDDMIIRVLAIDLAPVISKGGLTIMPELDFQPEHDLDDIDPLTTALLLLPDGTAWEDKRNRQIEPLIRHCLYHRIPVAAVGAATIALADLGILNRVKHTSDHPEYLKCFSPVYDGEKLFSNERCTFDAHVVTASSQAGTEFCDHVLHVIGHARDVRAAKSVMPAFPVSDSRPTTLTFTGTSDQ